MDQLNLLAVCAAAVSSFVIGGLWYSPLLFQQAWMAANNFKESDLQGGNTGLIFALSFVFALVMALNLAMFLNAPGTTLAWGATAGALTAIWSHSASVPSPSSNDAPGPTLSSTAATGSSPSSSWERSLGDGGS